MSKKIAALLAMILVSPLFFSFGVEPSAQSSESGTLSIYFMGEQVGYEEYIWKEKEGGYYLEVRGRTTKPISIEIETLSIHLDKDFIAQEFLFKGKVSGMAQEVSSVLSEGEAVNRTRIAGQESQEIIQVKRDAILLPNPVFSPYMVLTKKFRCGLEERIDLSAYIIPQTEMGAVLEPEEDPCALTLNVLDTEIKLETNDSGTLIRMDIPSKNLRIVRSVLGQSIRLP